MVAGTGRHPRALFVVSFIGPVAPHGGGTLILSRSPRLLIQQERQLPASQRRGSIATLRGRIHRSHPWFMALTRQASSPADRIAAFMDRETTVEGVPLRVVELTGEPGDMVVCHPVMVHCVAPNRGTRPRFMRIKTQVLTHEGRDLRSTLKRPRSLQPDCQHRPPGQTTSRGLALRGPWTWSIAAGTLAAGHGPLHGDR